MKWSYRRFVFWLLSTFAVLSVSLLVLELLGADCSSVGNNPMALDNVETCNGLGDAQQAVGLALLVVSALLIVAAMIAVTLAAARRLRPRR